MESEQPSSTGRLTRSQARKRPASAHAATPLKSPLLSDFFFSSTDQQPKRTRTSAPPTLRQVRKRGGVAPGALPALTGYLGSLPQEVSKAGGKPVAPAARGRQGNSWRARSPLPRPTVAAGGPDCCWAVGSAVAHLPQPPLMAHAGVVGAGRIAQL